jgi:hypothetical protein
LSTVPIFVVWASVDATMERTLQDKNRLGGQTRHDIGQGLAEAKKYDVRSTLCSICLGHRVLRRLLRFVDEKKPCWSGRHILPSVIARVVGDSDVNQCLLLVTIDKIKRAAGEGYGNQTNSVCKMQRRAGACP